MKRIIRLTESDLARIVRRVISEGPQHSEPALMDVYGGISVSGFFAPNDKINLQGKMRNFDTTREAKIFNGSITITPEGKGMGLTADNFTLPAFPIVQDPINYNKSITLKGVDGKEYKGQEKIFNVGFTAPTKESTNKTGKGIIIATINFNTNSRINPAQTVNVYFTRDAQFGVKGAQSKS